MVGDKHKEKEKEGKGEVEGGGEKTGKRHEFLVRHHLGEASHVQLQHLPLTQLLPSCPLCMARIDGAFSGLRAELIPDLFSFMAADSMRCFVCRVSDPMVANTTTTPILGCPRAACMSCGVRENIWACLICGHLGCGRYTAQHSLHHFSSYGHNFSLELATGRIWDYDRDTFVHSQDSQAVVSIGNGVTLALGGELGLAPLLRHTSRMNGVDSSVTSYIGQSMLSHSQRHVQSYASCNDTYRHSSNSSTQINHILSPSLHPLNREAAITMASEDTVGGGVPYPAPPPNIQQSLLPLPQLPPAPNSTSSVEEQTREKLHGMMDGYERIFEEQLELQRQYYEVLLARETRQALERKQIQQINETTSASSVAVAATVSITSLSSSSSSAAAASIAPSSEDEGAYLPQIDGAESDHYWGLKLAYALSSEDDMKAIENLKREISGLEDELSSTTREATEAEEEHRNMRRQNNSLVKQIQVLKERVGGFQHRREEILERKASEETMLLEQIRDLEQHLHTQEQIFHSDRGIREEIQTGNFIITEADTNNHNHTNASNSSSSHGHGDNSNKPQKQKQKQKKKKR